MHASKGDGTAKDRRTVSISASQIGRNGLKCESRPSYGRPWSNGVALSIADSGAFSHVPIVLRSTGDRESISTRTFCPRAHWNCCNS